MYETVCVVKEAAVSLKFVYTLSDKSAVQFSTALINLYCKRIFITHFDTYDKLWYHVSRKFQCLPSDGNKRFKGQIIAALKIQDMVGW